MPAIGQVKVSSLVNNVVKTTDAAIGVDATFDPAGINAQGVAKWEQRSGGIPLGYPTLTLLNRGPSKGSAVYKVTAKLSIPTMEQTSASTASGIQPAPTKAYDCTVIMDFLLPSRSTLAERQKLFSYLRSILMTTITASDDSPTDSTGSPIGAVVGNLETVY